MNPTTIELIFTAVRALSEAVKVAQEVISLVNRAQREGRDLSDEEVSQLKQRYEQSLQSLKEEILRTKQGNN